MHSILFMNIPVHAGLMNFRAWLKEISIMTYTKCSHYLNHPSVTPTVQEQMVEKGHGLLICTVSLKVVIRQRTDCTTLVVMHSLMHARYVELYDNGFNYCCQFHSITTACSTSVNNMGVTVYIHCIIQLARISRGCCLASSPDCRILQAHVYARNRQPRPQVLFLSFSSLRCIAI